MQDVYYSPEKYGLSVVGGLDEEDLFYEFNMLVVWQHADGRLFYSTDSGCSCPSPFENVDSLAALTPVNRESWSMFEGDIKSFPASSDDKRRLLETVRKLLRKS